VTLAELHHLIEKEDRAPQAGARFFSSNRTATIKKIRVAYVRVGVIRERGDKSVRSARDSFMLPIRP
jgi:hypothetical protein